MSLKEKQSSLTYHRISGVCIWGRKEGMKKISVGEVIVKNKKKGGNSWLVLFIDHPWKIICEWKERKMWKEKEKSTNEKEKDENEMWEWNEKKRRKKRCNVMRKRKNWWMK